jgi:hypothetical protein
MYAHQGCNILKYQRSIVTLKRVLLKYLAINNHPLSSAIYRAYQSSERMHENMLNSAANSDVLVMTL